MGLFRQLKSDSHRAYRQEKKHPVPKSGASGSLKRPLASKQSFGRMERSFWKADSWHSQDGWVDWQLAARVVMGIPCAALGWSHQGWSSAWIKGGKSRVRRVVQLAMNGGHPRSRGVQQEGSDGARRGQEPGHK